MELIKWELKKLLFLPMLFVFLLLCIAVQFFLMADGFFWENGMEYVQYINQITSKIGGKMGNEFDQMLSDLPEQKEKAWLSAETAGRTDFFEGYRTVEVAEYYIGKFRITGFVEKALQRKYQRLQARVEELAKQDVSMDLAAAGMTQKLCDHLFGRLCKTMITEGILLAVFLALYLCKSEQIQQTEWLYTTRVGRQVQRKKWRIGMVVSLFAYGILAGSTIAGFAGIWRLGGIWKANLSSQFYQIRDLGVLLPFVSEADFTIGGYLAAVVGMGAVVVGIFYCLGFLAGLLVQHTYGGFLAIIVFVAVSMEGILIAGDGGNWGIYEILLWSPVGVWWESPLWFSEMGASRLVEWQECWAAGIWTVVFLGLSKSGFRIFDKRDIQ